jgi:hypothetical protein
MITHCDCYTIFLYNLKGKLQWSRHLASAQKLRKIIDLLLMEQINIQYFWKI